MNTLPLPTPRQTLYAVLPSCPPPKRPSTHLAGLLLLGGVVQSVGGNHALRPAAAAPQRSRVSGQRATPVGPAATPAPRPCSPRGAPAAFQRLSLDNFSPLRVLHRPQLPHPTLPPLRYTCAGPRISATCPPSCPRCPPPAAAPLLHFPAPFHPSTPCYCPPAVRTLRSTSRV